MCCIILAVKTTKAPKATTTSPDLTPARRGCGSQYGCCTDGLIAAVGPNYLGCPGIYNLLSFDGVVVIDFGSNEYLAPSYCIYKC